jgi:hypothetical protein
MGNDQPKVRTIPRRDFLKTVPVAAGVLVGASNAAASFGHASSVRSAAALPSDAASRLRINTFDYDGVKLRDSRWRYRYRPRATTTLAFRTTIFCAASAPLPDFPHRASRSEVGA